MLLHGIAGFLEVLVLGSCSSIASENANCSCARSVVLPVGAAQALLDEQREAVDCAIVHRVPHTHLMQLQNRRSVVSRRLIVAAFFLVALGAHARANDRASVTLASGRTFSGFVDETTNEEQLVLRFDAGTAELLRPIAWSRIVAAEYQQRAIAPEELLRMIERRRSEDPAELIAPSPLLPPQPEPIHLPAAEALPQQRLAAPRPRIVALRIEAEVANWLPGAEIDGLLLRVYPLDEFGKVAPVLGTLNVTLVGTRPTALRSEYFRNPGEPFPRLGYWTRHLTPSQFAGYEARVLLPFQASHPEFDLELGALALVTAELAVPGEGVFAATDEFVRIRPYSPLRDWQQQLDGRRFFPVERTWRTQ